MISLTHQLFEEDFTAKPDKYLLVKELEKHLDQNGTYFNPQSNLSTSLIVDFMSVVRQMTLENKSIFKDMYATIWKMVESVCLFEEVHMLFDSYTDESPKKGERRRRNLCEAIEVVDLTPDTVVPIEIEKFWASPTNKSALRVVSREFFNYVTAERQIYLILSGYVNSELQEVHCVEYTKDNASIIRHELTSTLEDADTHVVLRVN